MTRAQQQNRPAGRRARAAAASVVALSICIHAGSADRSAGSKPSATQAPRTNRLAHEKSPYLQLHADNPVDWFPWGEAAFETARREHKPIFLSIGYSTCHWCHVMERESFSNPEIAALLNRHFVSIKVDREERPDIDRVYMTFVQATTGSGGWPMSVFLTPDLKPFFGGTYFPPEDRSGLVGFRTVLERLREVWANDQDKIMQSAEGALRVFRVDVEPASAAGGESGRNILDRTFGQFESTYDPEYGGFSPAPKFPRPVVFGFLLRYYARTGNAAALDMTRHTLRAMALGGLQDHLGGGFHRYSTDRDWRVPHFEKMLYDQAQIAVAYCEAYQVTADPSFADIARRTLDYVLRDLRAPDGGFSSAEDADSRPGGDERAAAEGAFYVWTTDQIRSLLGDEQAALFNYHFGVQPSGNVPPEQGARGELAGANVLSVRHPLSETATRFGLSEDETRTLLAAAAERLRAARARRARPPVDDKVLTAWNGLLISALARAAQVLDESRYLEAARATALFLESRLYDPEQNLLRRRYRQNEAAVEGVLEDYAFLIQGLLDLYETEFDVRWLTWAVSLQETQDRLFWDDRSGGYFATPSGAPHILVRMKPDHDGAEPSPNSVAALNLLRLWQITARPDWRKKADAIFGAWQAQLAKNAAEVPQLVGALDFSLSKPRQIVIAGRADAEDTRAMLRLVYDRFLPNKILLLADGGPGQQQLARWLPFVESVARKDGRATAYICEDYVCRLPTSDLEVAARLLDGTFKP